MTKFMRYLLLVGCFGFLIVASSCQQEQKVDLENELTVKFLEDSDFQELCEIVKDERQKMIINYYNIGKSNSDYVSKNATKLETGNFETKVEIFKNSGMTNVEEYVKNQIRKKEMIETIKKRYELYITPLGKEKFKKLLTSIIAKNSKPIIDKLHLIQQK